MKILEQTPVTSIYMKLEGTPREINSVKDFLQPFEIKASRTTGTLSIHLTLDRYTNLIGLLEELKNYPKV